MISVHGGKAPRRRARNERDRLSQALSRCLLPIRVQSNRKIRTLLPTIPITSNASDTPDIA